MALTIMKRGFKPLMLKLGRGTKAEARQVVLAKIRRKDGEASFLADMIALRKVLALCYYCAEHRLPRNWRKLFDYEELKGYHAHGHCDYKREEGSVGLYMPGDGDYWQMHEKSTKAVDSIQARDQRRYAQDRRYLVGA
jgi:hypothetical protein